MGNRNRQGFPMSCRVLLGLYCPTDPCYQSSYCACRKTDRAFHLEASSTTVSHSLLEAPGGAAKPVWPCYTQVVRGVVLMRLSSALFTVCAATRNHKYNAAEYKQAQKHW